MMRSANFILVAGALLGIGAASAADLPERTPERTYAAVPAALPVSSAYNWTGCYLGGYVGGQHQSRDVNTWDPKSTGGAIPAGTYYNPSAFPTPQNNNDGNFNYDLQPGAIGGGTLGCNWQPLTYLVVGVEGEGGYLKASQSSIVPYSYPTGSDSTSATRVGSWDAALTARLGFAWDRALFYLKGGVAFTAINGSFTDTCTAAPCSPSTLIATGTSHAPFWLAGFGIEYALTNDWSVKGELMVLGLFRSFAVCGLGAGPGAAGSTFCGRYNVEGIDTVKIGVNYHFNAPVIARY
jgi:outer membrane immunogenic protein